MILYYLHNRHEKRQEKVRILGKGSFGSVYLVTRKEDKKIYALKAVILEKLNKKEQENSVNEVRHPETINDAFNEISELDLEPETLVDELSEKMTIFPKAQCKVRVLINRLRGNRR